MEPSRRPRRPSPMSESSNPNVFDDEFAIDNASVHGSDDEMPVSDGFRSSGSSTARYSQGGADITGVRTPQRRSASRASSSESKENPFEPSPGTTKGRVREMRANAASSYYGPDNRRSTSSASSFTTTTTATGGPFAGTSGPSHPYAMYPQSTGVGRTSSLLSSSTVRASHRASSPRQRPAHPYGMYTQNVFEGPEEENTSTQSIPVGFPGIVHGGHRRRGPEGEELDIIGLDGHTEQLPPYSRYPEGHSEGQEPVKRVPVGASSEEGRSSDSQRTLVTPDVRAHRISSQSSGSPSESAIVPSAEPNEKSWNELSMKEKSKRKVCWGKVPLWLVVLGMVGLVLLAAVLGGVAGGVLTKQHFESSPNRVDDPFPPPGAIPPMYDASPIPTPSGMPSCPTGTFSVPLEVPEESLHSCLVNSQEFDTWSCSIFGPPAVLQIDWNPRESTFDIEMYPFHESKDLVRYGSVVPRVRARTLLAVLDLDEPERKAALHFQMPYDKVVIVPENHLEVNAEGQARFRRRAPEDTARPTEADTADRNEVQKGDRPWICYWNQTWIEGFIYQQNSSEVENSTSSSTTFSSSTPAYSNIPFSGSSVPTYGYNPDGRPPTASYAPPHATPTPGLPYLQRRRDTLPPKTPNNSSHPPAPFPRVIKIEELRIPDQYHPPYCEQKQLLNVGGFGDPIRSITLDEAMPRKMLERRDQVAAAAGRPVARELTSADLVDEGRTCHCQWLFS